MSLYCMCEAVNDKPDSQALGAPNRYCAAENRYGQTVEDVTVPPLALKTPMVCIKTGAAQVILDHTGPNLWDKTGRPDDWRRHYPNVDVFECPNCHARVAKG